MKVILSSMALILAVALSSCNTTIGFARDMRILGANMENTATRKLHGDGGSGNATPNDVGGAPVY